MERQRVNFNYHHNYNQPPPTYGNTYTQPPNFADHRHYNNNHHYQNYNQPPNYADQHGFHQHPPQNYNQPPNYYNQPPNFGPYPNQQQQQPFHNQQSYESRPNYESGYFVSGEPNEAQGVGGPGGGAGGGGGGFRFNGRKRSHDHFVRGDSLDHPSGATNAKLYIAPVTCTTTEEDLRALFGEHGTVAEVIIPKDKWIDPQQGYCFVKYAMLDEADRAIKALNGHYTFPGLRLPIKVRYADREQKRIAKPESEQPGTFTDKLYVGSLSKLTSKQEIEEIFSPYGYVEDVYIALDHLKQSRGYAFVKFPQRDMALAAIKGLHGTFIMRGCEQPLVVRFADPKRPRNGEFRSAHSLGDSQGGFVVSTGSDPKKVNPINAQTAVVHNINCEATACHLTEESFPPVEQPSSHLSQLAPQVVFETEKRRQNLKQEQDTQVPSIEIEDSKHPCGASMPSAASNALSSPNTQRLDPEECDWSEHVCPDGYRYYYNCETYESRWDKPEEFAAFQQRLKEQYKSQNPSADKNANETQLLKQESGHMRVLSETRQVIGSSCA